MTTAVHRRLCAVAGGRDDAEGWPAKAWWPTRPGLDGPRRGPPTHAFPVKMSIGGGWLRLRSGGPAVDAARERGGVGYITRPPPNPHERPEEATMSPDLTALDQEQHRVESLELGGVVRSIAEKGHRHLHPGLALNQTALD